MATVTPNYGFILPGVADPTDQDLWGGYLNENFEELDTLIFNNTLASVDPVFTTNYTFDADDNNKTLIFDTTSGDLTLTFPSAATMDNGFTVTIKKIGSSGVLNFSGTVDGTVNPTISTTNEAVTVTSNATAWYYKADYSPSSAASAETIIQKKIIVSSTTASLSSTSYVATGITFSLDDNLASASNKVRITVYSSAGVGANLGNSLYFTIKTGATDLAGAFSGLAGLLCDSPNGPTESSALDSFTMFTERTPGTVVKETYEIYARAEYTATNYYIGRNANNTRTLPTTIIIEEVQVN